MVIEVTEAGDIEVCKAIEILEITEFLESLGCLHRHATVIYNLLQTHPSLIGMLIDHLILHATL